jgi:microcystin-dependent protein
LVGIDSGDTAFDTVEETGGAKTHTLTEAEMPAHVHGLGSYGDPSTGGTYYYKTTRVSNQFGTGATSSTGSGSAHNNLQPYIVTYMWKRTA